MTRRRRLTATGVAVLALSMAPGLTQLPASADGATVQAAPDPTDPVPPAIDSRTIADPVAGLTDLDRRGSAQPTALQVSAVRKLDAVDVRWNQFGTPASLLPSDGSIARTTSKNPVRAARSWLVANAAVFGRTAAQMRDLELVDDHQLVQSRAHVVLFNQHVGGLAPALGSLVTVGVANGDIAYVSSTIAKTTGTLAEPTLSPLQGWLKAANGVGVSLPATSVARIVSSVSGGFTRLTVPGLAQEQQVRLRALAMADGSVRPVLEANVIDVAGGSSLAYTLMIDAVSGKVLHRENKVENYSDAYAAAPSTAVPGGLAAANGSFPFTGAITATTCGPKHTFQLKDDATKQIVVVAAALNTVNDIAIKLFDKDGKLLSSGDVGTSPEVLTYSAASLPKGTYAAQVCPFESPMVPLLPPYNYAMTVSTSDTAVGTGGGFNGLTGNPRWRFFPANPTLDSPKQTPRNSVVGCWRGNAKGCTLPTGELRDVESFGPWDTVGLAGISTNTTIGNNANSHEAWVSPLTPGGLFQAPISPTGDYTTKFTDAWNNNKCNPAELIPGGNDINFAVQNLFVTHNRMHDWSYALGFTESTYNLQLQNGSRGGTPGDPEIGNVQAGAIGGVQTGMGRDNANQIALQDGVPGITNQYLFQPLAGAFYAPCTDGDLDQGIVGHEYTHAISNRMVGGPDEGLTSEQGGAMGESWSDLDAAEYQFAHGYKNGGNTWAVGVYATGNKSRAIRDYSINHNPLNYSDYGFDTTGPEVHADGEIWNGTQWEVRQSLVEKWNKRYPYANKKLQLACGQSIGDTGVRNSKFCPGNRRWIQLVFDAFLLQQGATSMLDARDAMLAADVMRYRGKDLKALWDAFARRGMGRGAEVKDADDTDPRPNFRSPKSRNTKVVFKTSGVGNIYVGDYEARATPVADTFPKSSRKKFSFFTPGTYTMTYVGPSHGLKRFTMTVTGQERKLVKIDAGRNLAAKAVGARIIRATRGSLNPSSLIDGTEGTNWGGVTAANVDKSHPRIAVDLAGGKHKIRTVNVSALLHPAPGSPTDVPLLVGQAADPDSGSRFTALRRFALEACVQSCTKPTARWKRFFTSQADAFPAVRPRPTAPNLNMRTFAVKPTKAAALRLVVLENQCTGFKGYAGELDNDPLNDTDCKSASDRGTIVHVAELQAFTQAFRSGYNGQSRGLHTVKGR